MKTTFFYQELDLPLIPEELIPLQLNTTPENLLRAYQAQLLNKNGGVETSVENNLYHLDKKMELWIQDNVCKTYNDVGLKYNFYHPERSFLAPHTDVTRKYVLIYNLLTGDGELVFWREKNHDTEREPFKRHTPASYENLEEIFRVKTPLKKWFIMNATILHSVEKLTSVRAQFQVSLNVNPF